MIVVVVAAMAALGTTTWLAMQQSVSRDPERNRRMTALGLWACLAIATAALTATFVTF
jgi:hypothetical protein